MLDVKQTFLSVLRIRDEKIINVTSSRRYFFFTRAKFDANNELFKENLVKCKGKRTSQDVVFIIFSSLKTTTQHYHNTNISWKN